MDGLNRPDGPVANNSENSGSTLPDHLEKNLWGTHTVSPVTIDPYLQKPLSADAGHGSPASMENRSDQKGAGVSLRAEDYDRCCLTRDVVVVDSAHRTAKSDAVIEDEAAAKRLARFDPEEDVTTHKKKKKKTDSNRKRNIGYTPDREPSSGRSRGKQLFRQDSSNIEPRNPVDNHTSDTELFSSCQIIFSSMNLADCQSHLEIIIDIENLLIDAVKTASSKSRSNQYSRYLSDKQCREIRQHLTNWTQLAPAGIDIFIRDKLKAILDTTNDIASLRQLFPIHESARVQMINGQRQVELYYECQRSKQLKSILDVLKSQQRH